MSLESLSNLYFWGCNKDFMTTSAINGGNFEGYCDSNTNTSFVLRTPTLFQSEEVNNEKIAFSCTTGTSTFVVKNDGTFYGWGTYIDGLFPSSSVTPSKFPVKIFRKDFIIDNVRCSYRDVYFMSGSNLYGFGENYFGELCTGSDTHQVQPILISSGINRSLIGGGSASTTFSVDGNSIHTCGKNEYYELGHNSYDNNVYHFIPTLINMNNLNGETGKIQFISHMTHAIFVVYESGSVYYWGHRDAARMVLPVTMNPIKEPYKVDFFFPATIIPLDGVIKQLRTGGGAFAIVEVQGENRLYSWGSQDEYKIGRNFTDNEWVFPMEVSSGEVGENERVVSVSPGEEGMMFLTNMNIIYAFGRQVNGLIGTHFEDVDFSPRIILIPPDMKGIEKIEIQDWCHRHFHVHVRRYSADYTALFMSLIGLGLCCTCLIYITIFVTCFVFLITAKRRKKSDVSNVQLEKLDVNGVVERVPFKLPRNVKNIMKKDIKVLKLIGTGSSCSVFKGKWNLSDVAIKKFTILFNNKTISSEIEEEIKLMASFSHPGIVQVYGCSFNADGMSIIMEYCSNGDLKSFLQRDETSLSNREKIRILCEVAEVIQFLHERTPKIIHRDIKAENILLTESMKSKLVDFGISKALVNCGTITSGIGTPFYMAPEIVLGKKYDEKVDVFAFAILIHILFVENISDPYDLGKEDFVQFKIANNPDCRPHVTKHSQEVYPTFFKELAKRCWSHEVKKRPSFGEINKLLKKKYFEDEFLVYIKKYDGIEGNAIDVVLKCQIHESFLSSIKSLFKKNKIVHESVSNEMMKVYVEGKNGNFKEHLENELDVVEKIENNSVFCVNVSQV